ncbi:MAG: helix-turn-helix transcriptional regulator [Candidatus Geothermarchaeales archaeon]
MVGEKVNEWFSEMRKGYARLIILSLLAGEPKHGYELMKTIEDAFFGWSPSTSAIYPILHSMEEEGYVKSESKIHGKRETKVYTITEKGQSSLRKSVEKQAQFGQQLQTVFKDYASEVLGLERVEDMPAWDFLRKGIEKVLAFEGLPKEEMISVLERRKERLQQFLEMLPQKVENIERRIAELQQERS